jgi:hypothetical protein
MPVKTSAISSIEWMKDQLDYCPVTGIFKWKVNKKGHVKAGMEAGATHSKGYKTIRVNGVDYLAHRLAWAFFYGSISEKEQIDHINLDRKDNRILNLRKATHEENCRNTRCRAHNVSGLKGAHLDKRNGKYRARISIKGKQYWLGYFKTPELAHAVYCDVSQKLHGLFHRS